MVSTITREDDDWYFGCDDLDSDYTMLYISTAEDDTEVEDDVEDADEPPLLIDSDSDSDIKEDDDHVDDMDEEDNEDHNDFDTYILLESGLASYRRPLKSALRWSSTWRLVTREQKTTLSLTAV